MWGTETVQWVAVTTTRNELGNETTTDATPVDLQALVAARSSTERVGARTPAVLTGKTLYLPGATVEPGASDYFIVRGDRYDVDGEAHRWGALGVEVAITKAGERP